MPYLPRQNAKNKWSIRFVHCDSVRLGAPKIFKLRALLALQCVFMYTTCVLIR